MAGHIPTILRTVPFNPRILIDAKLPDRSKGLFTRFDLGPAGDLPRYDFD
jgi:hypothetical protein